ncbi:hypothetical protein BDN71DRAFT_1432093 [Pleurotus eryngii]|uniref:Uncharacterized protein n=1 Tax=Pleurotus eryngii TaxID=5323 RepID=A0A9P5ZU54_PLEER|nr:hypothetical protein BDN71DRAFT_1432093 [Pleurotus eryngii]
MDPSSTMHQEAVKAVAHGTSNHWSPSLPRNSARRPGACSIGTARVLTLKRPARVCSGRTQFISRIHRAGVPTIRRVLCSPAVFAGLRSRFEEVGTMLVSDALAMIRQARLPHSLCLHFTAFLHIFLSTRNSMFPTDSALHLFLHAFRRYFRRGPYGNPGVYWTQNSQAEARCSRRIISHVLAKVEEEARNESGRDLGKRMRLGKADAKANEGKAGRIASLFADSSMSSTATSSVGTCLGSVHCVNDEPTPSVGPKAGPSLQARAGKRKKKHKAKANKNNINIASTTI